MTLSSGGLPNRTAVLIERTERGRSDRLDPGSTVEHDRRVTDPARKHYLPDAIGNTTDDGQIKRRAYVRGGPKLICVE